MQNNRHKKKLSYIIFAPAWNENVGGDIVRHLLCHYLNEMGEEAYLFPQTKCFHSSNIIRTFIRRIIAFPLFCKRLHKLRTNPQLNTPKVKLWKEFFRLSFDDVIIVYSEADDNNPLQAKHVVRFLMSNPGNGRDGEYHYCTNEFIVRYSDSFARNFIPPQGSVVSTHLMTIGKTPDCYHRDEIDCTQRKGTAFLMRKGWNKKVVHDLTDSILIDNYSHAEIAEFFRHVKAFYSYDSVTAYTRFALLCGCPSYVILGEDETPEMYRPNENDRKYIRFGIDDGKIINMDEAYQYYDNRRKKQEEKNKKMVAQFVDDCENFFGK